MVAERRARWRRRVRGRRWRGRSSPHAAGRGRGSARRGRIRMSSAMPGNVVPSPSHEVNADRPPPIDLCGVRLSPVTEAQCVAHIMSRLAAGEGGWVLTVNLDILRQLRADPALAKLCQRCFTVADGVPLIWAS